MDPLLALVPSPPRFVSTVLRLVRASMTSHEHRDGHEGSGAEPRHGHTGPRRRATERCRLETDSRALQYVLYGRNFPLSTMRTRSPLGSGSREMSIEKSM